MPKSETRIRLALIEPNPVILGGYRSVFSELSDIEVTLYSASGRDVLAKIRDERIEVLMTDLQSTDIDATEIAHVLRMQHPQVRLIVNGSFHPGPLIKPLLRSGVCSYFIKDQVTIQRLEQIVKEVHRKNFCYTDVVTQEVVLNAWFSKKHQTYPAFSDREEEVLCLICTGKNRGEISKQLFISESTVKYHIQNLFEKAQVTSTIELALKAINSDWITAIEFKHRFKAAG